MELAGPLPWGWGSVAQVLGGDGATFLLERGEPPAPWAPGAVSPGPVPGSSICPLGTF